MSTTEQQQLQALTGHRRGPYLSFNAVNRAQIWQWCSAMGDNNPLYLDDDYRNQTEFDRVVAPPAMMQMWTMRDINDNYAPGSTDAHPYQVFESMTAMGYPDNVAVSYQISFYRYLVEGDRPKHFTTVVTISERKSTSLGEGFFVTERVEYLTQDEQPFAEALITYFQYRAADRQTAKAPHSEQQQNQAEQQFEQQSGTENNWQPDYQDLDSRRLTVGDTLPTLAIPINHRLIVGGAIATQDFVPVHHNVAAANAAAMPDIFMNILTTSGLCARYLSDWAGASSRLQTLSLQLKAPNHPGDTMIMQGSISSVRQTASKPVVEVDFSGKNTLGLHVTGSAGIALPL